VNGTERQRLQSVEGCGRLVLWVVATHDSSQQLAVHWHEVGQQVSKEFAVNV
jgi:hypothetical protein